jgi:lipoprotein NlpI
MRVTERIRFNRAQFIVVQAVWLSWHLAAAAETESDSAMPLLDYAQEQPLPTQPFGEAIGKRLARVQTEMDRHPPPPDSECGRTLGAIRFAQLYEDLGSARSGLGDYDGAIEAYDKALACTPRAPEIYSELASELIHVGRLAEARAAAEHGLAIDGEVSSLDSTLAQIDFIEEHWADAVARLRTVAITEPDDERATYWQCFLWLAQRRAGTRVPELVSRTEYDQWPRQILDTLNGTLTEAYLLSVIRKQAGERRRREILAEALYYIGQMRLANGETDTARRYFAATVNLKVLYFIEHHLALAEITKMRR